MDWATGQMRISTLRSYRDHVCGLGCFFSCIDFLYFAHNENFKVLVTVNISNIVIFIGRYKISRIFSNCNHKIKRYKADKN